jgi:hypothetical protein
VKSALTTHSHVPCAPKRDVAARARRPAPKRHAVLPLEARTLRPRDRRERAGTRPGWDPLATRCTRCHAPAFAPDPPPLRATADSCPACRMLSGPDVSLVVQVIVAWDYPPRPPIKWSWAPHVRARTTAAAELPCPLVSSTALPPQAPPLDPYEASAVTCCLDGASPSPEHGPPPRSPSAFPPQLQPPTAPRWDPLSFRPLPLPRTPTRLSDSSHPKDPIAWIDFLPRA